MNTYPSYYNFWHESEEALGFLHCVRKSPSRSPLPQLPRPPHCIAAPSHIPQKMASLAALIIALALGPAAASGGTPINGEKYTAVAEAGACRGNGGAELGDKVNQKLKQGLTQTECETECDVIAACLGYAFEDGASSAAAAYCIIYGPEVAGTCSATHQDTIEKCAAQGSCLDASVDACGLAAGDDCLDEMTACQNMGAVWTSAAAVWTNPVNGWEGCAGNSFATTHIDGANGNSAYTCYDLDLDDHEATCVNGPTHAGYNDHAGANTALYLGPGVNAPPRGTMGTRQRVTTRRAAPRQRATATLSVRGAAKKPRGARTGTTAAASATSRPVANWRPPATWPRGASTRPRR